MNKDSQAFFYVVLGILGLVLILNILAFDAYAILLYSAAQTH